jgi:hypothetical protein
MYHLDVFDAGGVRPTETLRQRASETTSALNLLWARHPDCERIEVSHDNIPLFAVDRRRTTPT